LGLTPDSLAAKVGGGSPSPLGDLFDPVDFIKANFMLEGNLERFESMDVREIRKLGLGFEFKGLVLTYFCLFARSGMLW
jgi:hypothetical protein